MRRKRPSQVGCQPARRAPVRGRVRRIAGSATRSRRCSKSAPSPTTRRWSSSSGRRSTGSRRSSRKSDPQLQMQEPAQVVLAGTGRERSTGVARWIEPQGRRGRSTAPRRPPREGRCSAARRSSADPPPPAGRRRAPPRPRGEHASIELLPAPCAPRIAHAPSPSKLTAPAWNVSCSCQRANTAAAGHSTGWITSATGSRVGRADLEPRAQPVQAQPGGERLDRRRVLADSLGLRPSRHRSSGSAPPRP